MQIMIDIPKDVLKRTVFYREFKDLNDCITTIKALENAVPVKRGKWIEKSTGGEHFHCCSRCGRVEWDMPNNYCPECGARMDKE